MRMTHTYATMAVSPEVYNEVKMKLEAAGYQDQIHEQRGPGEQPLLDMHGIALEHEGACTTRGDQDAAVAMLLGLEDDLCLEHGEILRAGFRTIRERFGVKVIA